MRQLHHTLSICALTLLLFAGTSLATAATEHHAQIRVWLDTPANNAYFESNPDGLDIVFGRRGEFVDLLVPLSELDAFLAKGLRAEVTHADVEEFYASRLGSRGDFGAYHTYSEDVAWMDELRALYPDCISAKWSIGQGHEGNDIWAFRISDNPEQDEVGEFEVLFDGMHHAREIMAAEMPMMLAEHLCEQYYAGDPEIVEMVNGHEIYIVPIVNPDGFLYNEQINPNGGGMWRKNRFNNGDGTWGVDLNRNYPYEWGCDWGSSGSTSSDTYRGATPGSEPETQAMMDFINAHDFVTAQSFHSYGELTLYPWGYTDDDSPDADIFRDLGEEMCQFNGYEYGQPGEVLYDVCGGSFDWVYGAQDEHAKIFSFSNEIGNSGDGFWPSDNRREALFQDNLWPSLYMISVCAQLRGVQWVHEPLPFIGSEGSFVVSGTPAGYEDTPIDAGSVKMVYRVNGGAFQEISMQPSGQPGEFGAMVPGQVEGTVVEYYLIATDNLGRAGTAPFSAPDGLYYFEVGESFLHEMEADRQWIAGAPADDANAGHWERVDPWATAAQPEDDHSDPGTHCWVTGQHYPAEPIGYNDVDGGTTTLLSPVYDFSGAQEVSFSYWRWYSNDQGNNPGEDSWVVELSNDGGTSWVELENTLESAAAWTERSYSLADYFPVAGKVQLRFVASDLINGSIVEAAVDDFAIAGVFGTSGVEAPTAGFQVSLASPYPNPFNPMTTVRFELAKTGLAKLSVYDVRGRMVRSLVAREMAAGPHTVTWDGLDAMGRRVASGSYIVRLNSGGQERSQRVMLLK